MTDISVQDLKKSFEVGHPVLDGLSFEVAAGERVGILGANGCGKTTLFRILSGELEPDEGTAAIRRGRRVGLISQIPVYPAGWTTEDVLREAHSRLRAMAERMQELEGLMATDSSESLLKEYDRLADDFRRLGGYDMDRERNRVANGLDIPAEMRQREFALLSGGEKTRVNLARLILEDTDILLLDEPTNHLDMRATEWLEDYILHFRGTVLAISHDRYFLDVVAQRCVEITEGKAELYSGNYSFYTVERQRRFEEKLKKYEKDQAKIAQLEAAAAKLHLWAFMGNDKLHKRAFSMEKRIEKLSQTERPKMEKRLHAAFKEREFRGDEVLTAEGLTKGYEGKALFSNLALEVTGGERIAIIGENGSGKTTLVKLIVGEEEPDAGWIRRGPAVKYAYLPQHVKFAEPERTAVDTLIYDCRCSPQEARDSLGAFGFSGEDALKAVGTLSGGEQSRLRLCMLMRGDINLLILDEPTNHLDLASREWMEDAIADYSEALIFVSHDRYFIEKFATRIWAFENGRLTDFRGSFSEYREYRARQEAIAQAAKAAAPKPEKKSQRKKGTPEREKEARRCEREIEKIESRLREIEREAGEHASDYQRLMELEDEKARLNPELDALYSRWEELQDEG
ncbi:MAG TPA: ABC-F family ATP-binding cassette domain-containing protein [Candidatus Scatomorpha pullistercoris]|uniref:ABC-F family ATP-binding cassette domain-containing protein n=1 Tax=Candidatus Scatomorpha pullistercoris TaxID=2840929 RepID=A0A9D1G7G3_9FIRM|nr:ABC-F family ATP-binding cassette domain-containing protein [Candidatus Scatomorpha pullistercoris]